MSRTFQAVYYRDPDGHEPVDAFIAAQPPARQQAIDDKIDWLNDLDDGHPHLPFPHSSQIEGELRELRIGVTRVLYARSERFLVLLHAFDKRTGRVSDRDVQLAADRFEDFRRRMDAQPRIPPRAAGRDAPPRHR